MERRRLIINFKNTPEDIALYESIKNHSSISGYIKDILKGSSKNEAVKDEKKSSTELNSDINNILEGL